MFDFMQSKPVRSRLSFGQGITDQGRTAIIEFTLPKRNTDSVIGAVGRDSSRSKDILEQYIADNVQEVHSGDVNAEESGNHYKAQVRIENKRPKHVDRIDEQMSQMFQIEDSRIHVI
jgi:hypothetical protein